MIFYICLILAMIVTVSGIVGSVRGVNLFGRVESPVHVMLAVSLINTCILYIPWFIYSWQTESGDFKNSLLIVPFMIVRLMQTVSMDADYEAAILQHPALLRQRPCSAFRNFDDRRIFRQSDRIPGRDRKAVREDKNICL